MKLKDQVVAALQNNLVEEALRLLTQTERVFEGVRPRRAQVRTGSESRLRARHRPPGGRRG